MNRSKELEIKGKKFTVNFPNNREYIEIQSDKIRLSSRYQELGISGVEPSYAKNLIDAIAHLRVLAPKLEESLNVKLIDLSIEDGLEIVEVYNSQFRPWYDELLGFIFKPKDKNGEQTTN